MSEEDFELLEILSWLAFVVDLSDVFSREGNISGGCDHAVERAWNLFGHV